MYIQPRHRSFSGPLPPPSASVRSRNKRILFCVLNLSAFFPAFSRAEEARPALLLALLWHGNWDPCARERDGFFSPRAAAAWPHSPNDGGSIHRSRERCKRIQVCKMLCKTATADEQINRLPSGRCFTKRTFCSFWSFLLYRQCNGLHDWHVCRAVFVR